METFIQSLAGVDFETAKNMIIQYVNRDLAKLVQLAKLQDPTILELIYATSGDNVSSIIKLIQQTTLNEVLATVGNDRLKLRIVLNYYSDDPAGLSEIVRFFGADPTVLNIIIKYAGDDIDKLRNIRKELDILSNKEPKYILPRVDSQIHRLKPWQQYIPDPAMMEQIFINSDNWDNSDIRSYYDYILKNYANDPMILQTALYIYMAGDKRKNAHIDYQPLMKAIDKALALSPKPTYVPLTRDLMKSIQQYMLVGHTDNPEVQQAMITNISNLAFIYSSPSEIRRLLNLVINSALDQRVGVDIRTLISYVVDKTIARPVEKEFTLDFINETIRDGDTTWINDPVFRRAVILNNVDAGTIVDEIKLRYISGPIKTSLLWLPDGRRIALFSDRHDYKGGCPSGIQGNQLHRLFIDHPDIDFDIIVEYEKSSGDRSSREYGKTGRMMDFIFEHNNCFDETQDPSKPQPYFANCPENVHYHRADLRYHKSESSISRVSDISSIKFLKWFEPIVENFETYTVEDFTRTLDEIIETLPYTKDSIGSLKTQIELFKQSKAVGYYTMLKVVAKRLRNLRNKTTLSPMFLIAALIVDMYAISRFERIYVGRNQQGAHEDYTRNTIFYAGDQHITTYIDYLKTMYKRSSIITVENPDGRCIDLESYNLSDFFSREV